MRICRWHNPEITTVALFLSGKHSTSARCIHRKNIKTLLKCYGAYYAIDWFTRNLGIRIIFNSGSFLIKVKSWVSLIASILSLFSHTVVARGVCFFLLQSGCFFFLINRKSIFLLPLYFFHHLFLEEALTASSPFVLKSSHSPFVPVCVNQKISYKIWPGVKH